MASINRKNPNVSPICPCTQLQNTHCSRKRVIYKHTVKFQTSPCSYMNKTSS